MKEPFAADGTFIGNAKGMLVVDFAKDVPGLVFARADVDESEDEQEARAERKIIGHVRAKVDMQFFEGRWSIILQAGEILEMVEPSERDRKDFEYQRKRDGKQLAVVRWRGKIRLLFGEHVERVWGGEGRCGHGNERGESTDGRSRTTVHHRLRLML